MEEIGDVERSKSSILVGEPYQHVNQSWDCSQVENEPEERDAIDWLMDVAMIRQWEEVIKDEERLR